jgi:hypothetical protein
LKGYNYSPFRADPMFDSLEENVRYPLRGKGLKISTFEEVLTKFRGKKINIEMKDYNKKVADILYKKLFPFLDDPSLFVVSSKSIYNLERIRALSNYTIATSICENEVTPFAVTTVLFINKIYHTIFGLQASIHQIPAYGHFFYFHISYFFIFFLFIFFSKLVD